jgi:polyhydroxyalkanoate synthesis regulator phasin
MPRRGLLGNSRGGSSASSSKKEPPKEGSVDSRSEDREQAYREMKQALMDDSGFSEALAEYIVDLQMQIDTLRERVSDLENSR